MPIIIAIALFLFVFKGGIFVVFGWLFNAVIAVFGFFANIFSDISMTRYQKRQDKTRKNCLDEIDTAYEAKKYKKVISLYREIIRDCDYLPFDVMKYCHIAADAVCQTAKTIPEYEEARTWTRIISARNGAYEKEAEQLDQEIYKRGYELLKEQKNLIVAAEKYIYSEEFDKADELLAQVADNGNLDALIMMTEIAISEIGDAETRDEAERLVERLEAIDDSLSAEWRKRFDENTVVRKLKHYENATEYFKEAEKQTGAKYAEIMLKGIAEWEKIYKIDPLPQAAKIIARRYVVIATRYMKDYHEDRFSIERALEYLKNADKWAKIFVQSGTPEACQLEKDVTEWIDLAKKALEE